MSDAQSTGRGGRNNVQPYSQRVMWIATPSTASGLIGLWLCEIVETAGSTFGAARVSEKR